MVPFAVPPAAKAVLELVCQLRDGDRDTAWQAFVNVVASGQYAMLSTLWEQVARLLGLEVTQNAVPPSAHAVRESHDPISGRVAWRV